ncbi:MAG: hypothetical protein AAFN92_22415, partial [Bacteroidota bacterium]
IVISGYSGHPVRRVRLTDVVVHGGRAGTDADEQLKYPDNDGGYPSPLMFGTNLPAYGAFLRYAEDVRFANVEFVPAAGEVRAPVVTLGCMGVELREVLAGGKVLRGRDLVRLR